MKKKAKKATVGERIVVAAGYVDSLNTLRVTKQVPQHRDLARRIDAALRRAFRDGGWCQLYMEDKSSASHEKGRNLAAKYRVKL